MEIAGFGGPEVLKIARRPRPVPGEGGVLVRVAAAGINRPDLLQRQGKYPPPAGASDIPGLEVAGEIVDSRDPRWTPGDKVCALLSGGGYAEYAVAPAGQCLPVPDGLSLVEAAALPETVFTVWANVFQLGRLTEGETLLVHGGSSGIGTMAIQLARSFGADVIVTAGSDEKCAACLRLGAMQAVNYRTADFVVAVTPDRVDVVLDMVGGDYVSRNLQVLRRGGRHVSIAVQGGRMATIDIVSVMTKRLTLTGSTLRPRSVAEKAALADELRETVWPRIGPDSIRPVIHQTFPLDRAADAHAMMEQGGHIGKIVLETT